MRLAKSLAGVGAVILIGAGVLFFIQYLNEKESPEKKAEEAMRQIEKAYREDPYGGITPEETLQLFIDALRKGDIELASRYFMIEDQSAELEYLRELKTSDSLANIIRDADRLELVKNDGEKAFFTIVNENKVVEVEVIMGRFKNGRWKILEL